MSSIFKKIFSHIYKTFVLKDLYKSTYYKYIYVFFFHYLFLYRWKHCLHACISVKKCVMYLYQLYKVCIGLPITNIFASFYEY